MKALALFQTPFSVGKMFTTSVGAMSLSARNTLLGRASLRISCGLN